MPTVFLSYTPPTPPPTSTKEGRQIPFQPTTATLMASKDDANFLLSCLTNCNPCKIDFEAVAKECGYSNTRSASNRLAAIRKATGASPTASSSSSSSTTCSASATTVTSSSSDKVTKRKSSARRKSGSSSKASRKTAENGTESMDSGGKRIRREEGDLGEQEREERNQRTQREAEVEAGGQ